MLLASCEALQLLRLLSDLHNTINTCTLTPPHEQPYTTAGAQGRTGHKTWQRANRPPLFSARSAHPCPHCHMCICRTDSHNDSSIKWHAPPAFIAQGCHLRAACPPLHSHNATCSKAESVNRRVPQHGYYQAGPAPAARCTELQKQPQLSPADSTHVLNPSYILGRQGPVCATLRQS